MKYLLLLLLAGCTTIDFNNHVEGWPLLKQETHVVSSEVMHEHCDKYGGWGLVTLACSEYFLTEHICAIWVTEGNGWQEEHERGHCDGYDHPGSDDMRHILANWNNNKRKD